MPFITRNMVRCMKGTQAENAGSKRIRDLPFALDPECKNKIEGGSGSDNGKKRKTSAPEKSGGAKKDNAVIHFENSPRETHRVPKTNPINNITGHHHNNHHSSSSSSLHHSNKASSKGVQHRHSSGSLLTSVHSQIEFLKPAASNTMVTPRRHTHSNPLRREKSGPSKSRQLQGNPSKSDVQKRRSRGSYQKCNVHDGKRHDSKKSRDLLIFPPEDTVQKTKQTSPCKQHGLGVLNTNKDKDNDEENCEAIYHYTLSILKSNIKELCDTRASESIQSRRYKNYIWNKHSPSNSIKPSSCEEVYNAKMKEHPNTWVICKIYDGRQYDSEESRFLKLLNFLKVKHPNIITTYDIFADNKEIYVFQRLESHGNMKNYIRVTSVFKEYAAQICASHLLRAINYLGVMGISHRSIQPIHVLISLTDGEFIYKISGFHEAIDYWNSTEQEIFYKHCISIDEHRPFDFRAPEMFGLKTEVYDPVMADIWSFGATIFYSLTEQYPFNVQKYSVHIIQEIDDNIQKLKVSGRCKEFLQGLLNVKAAKRIHFNKMYQMRWLEFLG